MHFVEQQKKKLIRHSKGGVKHHSLALAASALAARQCDQILGVKFAQLKQKMSLKPSKMLRVWVTQPNS